MPSFNLAPARLLYLFAFLLLLPVPGALAQSGPLFSDGQIQGRIVDSAGRGIAGISVSLQPLSAGRTSPSATTDAAGYYQINAVEYGDYRIHFYDWSQRYVGEYYPDTRDPAAAMPITIGDRTPVVIDAELALGGRISGVVTFADDSRAEGATVRVLARQGDHWRAVATDWRSDDGSFNIGGLAPGSYIVEASDYVDGRSWTSYYPGVRHQEEATPIVISGSEHHHGKTFELLSPQGATVAGRVTGVWNRPLAGIEVTLYRFAPEWVEPWRASSYTTTDAEGRYHFDALGEGYYKVGFEDRNEQYAPEFNGDQPTLGAAGAQMVARNGSWTADARLDVGGEIAGTVISGAGTPADSLSVSVYRWNNHDAYLLVDFDYFRRTNGRFVIGGLPAGQYKIRVSAEFGAYQSFFGWFGGDSEASAEVAEVALYRKTNVGVIVLNPDAGIIQGVVRDANGRPLAGVSVELIEADNYFGPSTFTALDGSYRFRDLPPGDYILAFSDERSRFTPHFYGGTQSAEEAQRLTLPPGGTVSADVTMAPVGGISGRVRLSTNEPIDYGNVTAYRLDGSEWRAIHSASVGRDGYYTLSGLEAGDYRLHMHASADRHYSQPQFQGRVWWPRAVDEADAAAVTVVAGQVTPNVDAVLPYYLPLFERRDGVISGQVVADDSGDPIGGVQVELYRHVFRGKGSFWELAKVTTTDADGRYWLGGLPFGDFRLGFNDPIERYEREYYNDRTDFDIAFKIVLNEDQPLRSGADVGLATRQRMVR